MAQDTMSSETGVWLALDGDDLAFGIAPYVADITCSVAVVRRVLGEGCLDGVRVEVAIAEVEDRIMPLLGQLPDSPQLGVVGEPLVHVIRLISTKTPTSVSIKSVEALFNDLADHAMGSPTAWRHDVDAVSVVLPLLVLREVMHHGQFRSVTTVCAGQNTE